MDNLTIKTVDTGGKFANKYIHAGAVYLNVNKGKNQPNNQIAVEVHHSSGVGVFKTEHKRENALINITFEDGWVWSGGFDDLKKILIKKG